MKNQPKWHTLAMLPTYVTLSAGELSAAKEQLNIFMSCKHKHYVLDDHTINRVIKLCTSQNKLTWSYLEQGNKWRQQFPSNEQLISISSIENNAKKLETINGQMLKLVNGCFKSSTIDAILRKDDVELAMDFLSGKMHFDQ